ncbi:MAG TPA: RtcB family protein [Phycisphaerales bacterium]|nr:RtcB family protein [Phycisphaerales bacterium]
MARREPENPIPLIDPVPISIWGEGLEPQSLAQMENARRLPVAVASALMPDAHVGFGVPIGGVLATRNAVIPYAVGVDIACRMKMTVLDIPPEDLEKPHRREKLARAIEQETRFGIGARFEKPRSHEVLDEDWGITYITRKNKDKAREQLGTSGSGNHFVEFGTLTVTEGIPNTEARGARSGEQAGNQSMLPPGVYTALLTHSGSRGTGAAVCDTYSRLAMELNPNLPSEVRQLAWLDLNSQAGGEYWAAMELMGQYAAANHACIHKAIAKNLGVEVLADIENHHNFAWKERHVIDGREEELVVHRKGATPAGAGVLGIIPGSMATPGFVVRGKGNAASLHSASHGAGRVMSRTAARSQFTWSGTRKTLAEQGITVLSAGADESPGVYKDIHQVMAAQQDLVEVLARFDPRLVKMAPEGERAED